MNYREANTIVKDLLKNPDSRNKYTKSDITLALDIVDSRLQRQRKALERSEERLQGCRDVKAVDKALKEVLER